MARPAPPASSTGLLRRRTRTYDPNPLAELFAEVITYVSSPFVSAVNTGDLKPTMRQVAEDGWLICDGSTFDDTVFPDLAAQLGGNTLPDMRNRVPRGASAAANVGQTGGQDTHTITVAQLPEHNHAVTDPGHRHGITDPGHDHGVEAGTTGALLGGDGAGQGAGQSFTGITETDDATTGISIENTGGGEAIPTLPAYLTMNWMIKT